MHVPLDAGPRCRADRPNSHSRVAIGVWRPHGPGFSAGAQLFTCGGRLGAPDWRRRPCGALADRRRRRRSPAAWRRLTVAYAGSAVPSGEAAGYLLEVGPLKWMYYRSLLPALEP